METRAGDACAGLFCYILFLKHRQEDEISTGGWRLSRSLFIVDIYGKILRLMLPCLIMCS